MPHYSESKDKVLRTTVNVKVRLTPAEYASIHKAARRVKMRVGEYLAVHVDVDTIIENDEDADENADENAGEN